MLPLAHPPARARQSRSLRPHRRLTRSLSAPPCRALSLAQVCRRRPSEFERQFARVARVYIVDLFSPDLMLMSAVFAAAAAALIGVWHSGMLEKALAYICPPTIETAPGLILVLLLICVYLHYTFFATRRTSEHDQVIVIKQRLILAQMIEALKWDKDDDDEKEGTSDEKAKKEGDEMDKDKKKKKKPPSVEDLFGMLYDDAEERHVTAYGIDAADAHYRVILNLFRERLSAEFEEGMNFTKQARGDKKVDKTDASYEPKTLAEYQDGTKLRALVDSFAKIKKTSSGRTTLSGDAVLPPKEIVESAKKYTLAIGREQRKGMRVIFQMRRPLIPMITFGIILVAWDAYLGPALFASTFALLDGIESGKTTVLELRNTVIQVRFPLHARTNARTNEVNLRLPLHAPDYRDLDHQHCSWTSGSVVH